MRAALIAFCAVAYAQASPARQPSIPRQNPSLPNAQHESSGYADQEGEKELQTGTDLTRRAEFTEAIPHLVAARGRVVNDYAADFNLALCYVATGQPQRAIPLLTGLRDRAHDNADVNNLLAQAYIGELQEQKAMDALKRAASLTPTNEKLYMFVADACMGKQAYPLGMQVVDLGLKNLPNSAQLHFERGMFLTLADRFDDAKGDFDKVRSLAPESEVAYIAGAQEAMFAGNISEAVRVSRRAIANGHRHFLLLTLFGEALLRSGVAPGQKEFEEARQALETAVAERPNYPSSQGALGKLYLLGGQTPDAITHLEKARALSPGNPAVYPSLASAYRKAGDLQKAQEALGTLAKLNEAQAERIRTALGETKTSYGGASQQH
jgi:predicted Zn-dependent protease